MGIRGLLTLWQGADLAHQKLLWDSSLQEQLRLSFLLLYFNSRSPWLPLAGANNLGQRGDSKYMMFSFAWN